MASPELAPVRLRRGMGVALALQWNLPVVLIVRQPWPVVHLILISNCFLWAGGLYLMGYSQWWRGLFFREEGEGAPPRWRAAAIWMLILGTANLLAWHFEFRDY